MSDVLNEKKRRPVVRGVSLVAASLVALATLAGTVPAHAADTVVTAPISASDEGFGTSEQAMIDVWTEYGVPAGTQDALLEKLASGTPFDSMTEATPISSDSYQEGAKQVVVSRFADGSISISTIAPDSSSLARSVDGCTVNAATYAQNCDVYGWWGGVELHFRTSYTKQDLHASIYNWGQAYFLCGPGVTCSAPTFELVRQYQSGTAAAQLNLYTDWNIGIANGRTTLKLYAKDRSAWTN